MSSNVTSAAKRVEQIDETLPFAARQARRRLVEHHQVGVGDDRHPDLELPLLTMGEVADGRLEAVAEPHRPGCVASPDPPLLVDRRSPQRSVATVPADDREVQVVLDREAGEEARPLVGAGDPEARPATRGQQRAVDALDPDPAGGRPDVAGHDVEQRRLAGTVGTEDRQPLALDDIEIDAAQGEKATERDRHRAQPEQVVVGSVAEAMVSTVGGTFDYS